MARPHREVLLIMLILKTENTSLLCVSKIDFLQLSWLDANSPMLLDLGSSVLDATAREGLSALSVSLRVSWCDFMLRSSSSSFSVGGSARQEAVARRLILLIIAVGRIIIIISVSIFIVF